MIANGTLVHTELVPTPQSALNMARRAMSALDFERYSSVTLHNIFYMSEGLRIQGFLALPPADSSPLPALIFNRGGSGPGGVLTAQAAMSIIGLYASWGYVVVASNYRGLGASEGASESWGADDVTDAMNCLPLLLSLPYVDQERIGLIGGSRGGMMAYQMLTQTSIFKAAVTFGAPSMIHAVDHSAYIRKTMVKHLPATANEQAEAEKRSAVLFADKLCATTPLLVLHGTGDKRVAPEHSLMLAMQLQRNNHPYKLVMYDNADHVLAGRRNEANTDIQWWVNHYVRDKAALPRVGPHGA